MTLVTHPHDIGGNTDMSTNAGIYNCHPAPVRHGLSCSGNRYVVRVAGCQRGSKRAGAQDKLVIRRLFYPFIIIIIIIINIFFETRGKYNSGPSNIPREVLVYHPIHADVNTYGVVQFIEGTLWFFSSCRL